MRISLKKCKLLLPSLWRYNKPIYIETGTNGVTWLLLYIHKRPIMVWYEEAKYRISFPESYLGVGYPQALCRSAKLKTILHRLQTYIQFGFDKVFEAELNDRANHSGKTYTLAEVKRHLKNRKVKPLCYPNIIKELAKPDKLTGYA